MDDRHYDRVARWRSCAGHVALIALCLALSGCASQQAAGGLHARIADDPGCRELLSQGDQWEVQRARMFLGVEDKPYAVKGVVSGGDTLVALVPSQGKRIAVLAVARRPNGAVYFVESVFGTRIRPDTWQLSHDIGGEPYEGNGGMASGRNYPAILERVWDTLPYRR